MRVSLVKRPLMRLLCFSTVLICSAFSELHAQPSSQPVQEPRTEIALFRYRGVEKGEPSGEKFGVFRGIVDEKLLNLKKEVLQTWSEENDTGAHLKYLNKVHIEFRDQELSISIEDINIWMGLEATVLNLMSGTITKSDDKPYYIVRSQFYLGKLCAYLPHEVISVELPVTSTELANTIDSHTLIILYALAMDARSLGYPKDRIALFLKAAENKISDLEMRRGSLSGDLAVLKRAIRQATTELLGDQ